MSTASAFAPLIISAVIVGLPQTGMKLNEAHQLIEQGQVEQARTMLRRALENDPGATPARVLLGQTYLADDLPAARAEAVAVLRTGVRSKEALDLLSASYARARSAGMSRAQELRVRRLEVADYGKLLELQPEWGDVLYRSASQRLAVERLLPPAETTARGAELDAAIAELERLSGLLGTDAPAIERASAHYQLGRAYKHAADFLAEHRRDTDRRSALYRQSLEALERAFEEDPSRVDAVGEIVLVQLALDDTQAAIRAVSASIEHAATQTGRAKLYSMLGNLYLRAGRTEEAVTTFETVLSIEDGLVDTYLGLYRIHRERGDAAAAEATMQAAVDAEPSYVFGHLQLGKMSAERGDYETAVSHFERALGVAPASAVVLGMIPSRNLYRNGLYYRAAAWLAWLYLEHGKDPERALRAVKTAARFGPLDARLADTEGWSHFRLGDYARAREVLEAAANKSGDFPAVHYHLARTYEALGDASAATRSVSRALAFEEGFSERADAKALEQKLRGRQ